MRSIHPTHLEWVEEDAQFLGRLLMVKRSGEAALADTLAGGRLVGAAGNGAGGTASAKLKSHLLGCHASLLHGLRGHGDWWLGLLREGEAEVGGRVDQQRLQERWGWHRAVKSPWRVDGGSSQTQRRAGTPGSAEEQGPLARGVNGALTLT